LILLVASPIPGQPVVIWDCKHVTREEHPRDDHLVA
jgi:hypothetical protein